MKTVEDLWNVSIHDIIKESFDEETAWFIYGSAYGYYDSDVHQQLIPKSLGANKEIDEVVTFFPG